MNDATNQPIVRKENRKSIRSDLNLEKRLLDWRWADAIPTFGFFYNSIRNWENLTSPKSKYKLLKWGQVALHAIPHAYVHFKYLYPYAQMGKNYLEKLIGV